MDTRETAKLCKNVEFAAIQIRREIGYRSNVTQVLNRFWLLQDSLNRLIDAVDIERGEVGQSRMLIPRVVVALESQTRRQARSLL